MKSISRLYINFSSNLEKTGITETGRKFENTCSFPVLYVGTTFAIFSCTGKIPRLKDKLHICVSGIVMQSLMFFISPAPIHSTQQSYL